MKIMILHDQVPEHARSDEADALVQAQAVSAALRELGHQISTVGVSFNLQAAAGHLRALGPDLVFNLVESLGGHGRLIHVIPGMLDALGIPYTGAPAEAQFATSNKLFAKRMMRAANLPTPAWLSMDDLAEETALVPGKYIVKSVWEHASVGLDEHSVVEADAAWQLGEALETRLDQLGGEGFAEQYIDGREFNVALLADGSGPQVLPPAEIVFEGYGRDKPRVVGYRAKWAEESYEFQHTPRCYEFPEQDAGLIEHLSSIALECWSVFGLRGYARVDFRVDEAGRPFVLEINTNPCLSPDAGFAAALQQANLPFAHAIDRIIADALRPPNRQAGMQVAVVDMQSS